MMYAKIDNQWMLWPFGCNYSQQCSVALLQLTESDVGTKKFSNEQTYYAYRDKYNSTTH